MSGLDQNETLVVLTNAKDLHERLVILQKHSPDWPELEACMKKSEMNIKEIEYFSEIKGTP